jgi:hypothetical protein
MLWLKLTTKCLKVQLLSYELKNDKAQKYCGAADDLTDGRERIPEYLIVLHLE